MEKSNIKEFYGKLYTIKENVYLGEVFCIIEINKNLPEKVNIYFKNRLLSRESAGTNLKIKTSNTQIFLYLKSYSHIERFGGGFEASVIYGKPARILFIEEINYLSFEDLNKNEFDVLLSINDIEHLNYDLNSYKVEILNDLDKIKETTQKYTYGFKGYVNNFNYLPQVETIRDKSKNEHSFYFKHTLNFKEISTLGHLQLLKHIKEVYHPIYFVFNILSRFDFDYRSIYLRRFYRNKKFVYQEYNNEDVNKTGESNLGLNSQNFLKLTDELLHRFSLLNSRQQFVFRVICNRLIQIKKERDISLNITFWHVIVTHLIKSLLNGDYFKLDTVENVKRTLNKLQMNDAVADVVVEINRLRNDHFKKLTKDKDMGNISDPYNSFIQNVFVKLFSKFLELDAEDEETLRKIFWNVYNLHFR